MSDIFFVFIVDFLAIRLTSSIKQAVSKRYQTKLSLQEFIPNAQ